ncbi:Peptidase M8 [Trypanosoma melophagium]|nr:Peptidase M8 [Trypanosoma melophagium]
METRGEKAGPVSPIQERTAAVKTQTLTALTAAVRTTRCPEKKVCAVEKQRELGRKQYQFSHWKRRNAKDELMAGIVGAGYYTALTMAAFADLGYYMKWHACAEGTKLNVDTTELKGRIVCPKYDDVCNTINRTLDAVEGPPPPPPPKPETQPDKPKADNPTTAKNPTDSFAQGTTVSTATTTTRTPSTQGNATPNKQESVTPNGNTKGATATGDAAAGTLGSKNNGAPIDPNAVPSLTNINSNSGVFSDIPHTDAVAAPAAEAAALFGPFVCLLLVTTMVALS